MNRYRRQALERGARPDIDRSMMNGCHARTRYGTMTNTEAIPSRLTKAIVASVLFPLFGVVAIFYARKVTPTLARGNLDQASALAEQAKAWIELTLASAAVVWGTVLILILS